MYNGKFQKGLGIYRRAKFPWTTSINGDKSIFLFFSISAHILQPRVQQQPVVIQPRTPLNPRIPASVANIPGIQVTLCVFFL